MECLLAPHGPYQRVLRPADGKEPESIAYIQYAGSRDKSLGVSYCSRVCCMYAIKQAMLLSGALPLAEVTIYYMDIRAFGKGYEQFFQNAKAIQAVPAGTRRMGMVSENDKNTERPNGSAFTFATAAATSPTTWTWRGSPRKSGKSPASSQPAPTCSCVRTRASCSFRRISKAAKSTEWSWLPAPPASTS